MDSIKYDALMGGLMEWQEEETKKADEALSRGELRAFEKFMHSRYVLEKTIKLLESIEKSR